MFEILITIRVDVNFAFSSIRKEIKSFAASGENPSGR